MYNSLHDCDVVIMWISMVCRSVSLWCFLDMIYNFIFQNSICFMLVLLELTIVNCMLWSMFEEMLILLEVIFLIIIVLLFNDDSDICYPVSVWCNDFCLLVPSSIFFLDPFIRGFVCWFVMKLSCWNLSWSWDTVNCMCWVI